MKYTGPWTIEAVEELPEDGYRYEILAPGVLTVSPAPAGRHQRVSFRLSKLLDAAVPQGLEVVQTINVEIPGGKLCQPDIVSELRRGRYVQVVTVEGGGRSAVPLPFRVELDPAELVGRAGG